MNIGEWLQCSTKQLNDAGIATARLDCLVLLEDATGKDRAWLLAHPEFDVKGRSLHILEKQVERRVEHEPLAYIRGKTEFYGREFFVNKHTLEPRPETETMVDLLQQLADSKQLTADSVIVDVGTGSGCIGITVKLEMPVIEVIVTDVSKKCLRAAKENAKNLGADVEFYHGDLFQTAPNSTFYLPKSTFAILANLPYVPNSHTINKAAMQEPKLAIFGGEDGLDLYRRMFEQLEQSKIKLPYILTESLPTQHENLAQIALQAGYTLLESDDFIQVFGD